MYASRVGCGGSACGGTSVFGRSSCSEALPLDVASGFVGLPEDTGGGFSRGSVEPEASTSLAVGATMSVGRSGFHGVLSSHLVDLPEQQPPPPFLGFAMLRVPDLLAGYFNSLIHCTRIRTVRGQVAVVVRADTRLAQSSASNFFAHCQWRTDATRRQLPTPLAMHDGSGKG